MTSSDKYVFGSPNLHPPGFPVPPVAEQGGKTVGLFRIPPDWYPLSLVVSPRLHEEHAAMPGDSDLADVLDIADLSEPISTLRTAAHNGMLLVRSNSSQESIVERGRYVSVISEASGPAIAEALQNLWSHAAGRDGRGGPSLGALLQPLLESKLKGHLSNEHRVSRETSQWLVEWHVGGSVEIRSWRINSAQPADDGPLIARNVAAVETQLRRVARRLSELPFRFHLEWVWDGTRVWIVQSDRVPPTTGRAPGDQWMPARGLAIASDSLRVWRRVDTSPTATDGSQWPKIACLRQFQQADLPVPGIWQLSGSDVIQSLAAGVAPAGLMDDLNVMCSGHIVIRTDVSDTSDLMKARSDALTDPSLALGFLQRTSRDLLANGHSADSLVFLAHRFIRARGGAWTWATPNGSLVRVDKCMGV